MTDSENITKMHPAAAARESGDIVTLNVVGWTSLHLDFIESIIAFLSLRDLPLLVRLSRHYRAVASKIRTHNHQASITSPEDLAHLLEWSHRRWIGKLRHYGFWLGHGDLERIRIELTRLREMECVISIQFSHTSPPVVPLPLQFGALRSLSVSFGIQCSDHYLFASSVELAEEVWVNTRVFMESVAIIPSLEQLTLEITGVNGLNRTLIPTDLVTPLLQLRNTLNTLSIFCSTHIPPVAFDQSHVDIIRQFSSLTSLNLSSRWTSEQLDWLVQEPNQFAKNLTYLDLSCITIEDEHAIHISKLTGLTLLQPEQFALIDVSFVGHLKQLKTLQLHCKPQKEARVDSLTQALSHCTQIEEFALQHSTMTDEQLSVILLPFTKLRCLILLQMKSMVSCTCLNHAHLSVTLNVLHIIACSSLPRTIVASSLNHLYSLESVTRDGIQFQVPMPKVDALGLAS